MPQKDDERNIILALQPMQNDPKLSARAAGKIYTVSHVTAKTKLKLRDTTRYNKEY
jgi:hypothetical protein